MMPLDTVWDRMERGMRPDGTRLPKLPASKGRYVFTPHQSKRERRRRLKQAAHWHLSPEQFFDFAEFKEAAQMHLVVLASDAA